MEGQELDVCCTLVQ